MFSLKIVPQASLRNNRWTLRDLGGKVLREYLQTGEPAVWSVASDYIHRDGLVLAADTSAGQRHYHLDHLGTPRLITNASGTKVAFHTYFPFGEEATSFNQDAERLKFTGHERDLGSPAGTGDDLDYMHARFHSPVVGRFLSVDPSQGSVLLTRPLSWNRYAYSLDNPLSLVDPDGRNPVLLLAAAAFVGGFLFGPEAANAPTSPDDELIPNTDMSSVAAASVTAAIVATALNALGLGEEGVGDQPTEVSQDGEIDPRERGRASEARVLQDMGLDKNTAAVSSGEGTSVPDAQDANRVVEIKDSQRVSDSRQIRIQREAAEATGREHVVVTGESTKVSTPVQTQSKIIRRKDLGPPPP